MSAATIVLPTGVPARTAIKIPVIAHATEMIAVQIVTEKKLLKRRIEESAGKTMRAEMRSDPTRFMASTMMTAVMIATRRLYASA